MFSKYGGKMKKIKLLFFASSLSLLSFSASAVDITIARFFGDCEDAGSDTTVTSGEACIIPVSYTHLTLPTKRIV